MPVDEYPHGRCQCRFEWGCQGPASLQVERDNSQMLVCTRCTFYGDVRIRLTDGEDLALYREYDNLGAEAFLVVKES